MYFLGKRWWANTSLMTDRTPSAPKKEALPEHAQLRYLHPFNYHYSVMHSLCQLVCSLQGYEGWGGRTTGCRAGGLLPSQEPIYGQDARDLHQNVVVLSIFKHRQLLDTWEMHRCKSHYHLFKCLCATSYRLCEMEFMLHISPIHIPPWGALYRHELIWDDSDLVKSGGLTYVRKRGAGWML